MTRIILILIIPFLFANSSLAFDGDRNGFILGAELGLNHFSIGERRYKHNQRQYSVDPVFYLSLGDVDDQKSLSIEFSAAWPYVRNINHDLSMARYFSEIVSFKYYIKPQSPCMFFHFDFGMGTWSGGSKDKYVIDDAGGIMFGIGMGYEFRKHYSVHLRCDALKNIVVAPNYDYRNSIYSLDHVIIVSLSLGAWAY